MKKKKKKKGLDYLLRQISEENCLFHLSKSLNEEILDRTLFVIKHNVIKHLILLNTQSMMDIKELLLQ